jgi:hypothetical protein
MDEITVVAVVPGVRGAKIPAFVEPLLLLLPPPFLLEPPEDEREEDAVTGALDFSVDFAAIERVDLVVVVVAVKVLELELGLGLSLMLLLLGVMAMAALALLLLGADFGDEVGVDSDPDPDKFINNPGVTGARAILGVKVPFNDGEAVFWVWDITVSTEAAMVGVDIAVVDAPM